MAVVPYPCIREGKFLYPRMKSHPQYDQVLELLKSNKKYVIDSNLADTNSRTKSFDIGCAFGTDLRQLEVDGVSAEQIYGLDENDKFFKLGLELYEDDSEKSKKLLNHFCVGDLLSSEFPTTVANLIKSNGNSNHLLNLTLLKQIRNRQDWLMLFTWDLFCI